MKTLKVVLRTNQPLLREVFESLVRTAGIEVVGSSFDFLSLLHSISHLRPDAVVMWTAPPFEEHEICNTLLLQYPELKIVVVSPDHYTISDVGARTRQFSDLSMDSIRASVLESFTQ